MTENRLICICKGVTKVDIVNALNDGAKTVEDVADKTGATKGGCKGLRCINPIENIIEDNK